MMKTFLFALLALVVHGDVVVENDLIIAKEIYDFTYSTDSDVWWQARNTTNYYCIFRNLWTKERHPNDYPKMAKWSDIMLYSSTKDFRPWLKNRATTLGIETLAEAGFTDKFKDEMKQAGERVLNYAAGDGFFIDQEHWDTNYVYIPPIQVSFEYPFLNAAAGIFPSPDWFTGFYLFDVVDEYDRTFWDRFTIRTYPWDAGTDAGESYTAEDRDLDPPINVARIYPENAPKNGAFLSPDGTEVLPVGEFDCVLHTCPLNDPACLKPDWPPQNYCDILKYPKCATYCDPKVDKLCEPCKGNGYEPKTVYMADCCAAGHLPKHSDTCVGHVNSGGVTLRTVSLTLSAILAAWFCL